MQICVLVASGAFDTGLAAVLDTFQIANELSGAAKAAAPFRVRVCGAKRRIKTQQGFAVPLTAPPRARPDVVVVPALGAKFPEALGCALAQQEIAELGKVLSRWSRAGALVSAACTGTFVVAEAGLLNDREATTSWWLGPYFRERYPRVTLQDSKMMVAARGFVTAGAALAHLDLALWLVRQRSPQLAQKTASFLTFEHRSLQSNYVMLDCVPQSDAVVEKFESWARKNLASFSLEAAARAVGASERTLERRLQQALGKSPLSFVQDLRVESAVHQLRTSDSSLEEIAADVGYSDAVTLRTLLRRKTGRGVRELRP